MKRSLRVLSTNSFNILWVRKMEFEKGMEETLKEYGGVIEEYSREIEKCMGLLERLRGIVKKGSGGF